MAKISIDGDGLKYSDQIPPYLAEKIIFTILSERQQTRIRRLQSQPAVKKAGKCQDANAVADR